jgi:Ca2+/Na+ antiporter
LKNEHTNSIPDIKVKIRPEVVAGLPGASSRVHKLLTKAGINADRLSILNLGRPPKLLKNKIPRWVYRMSVGYFLWLVMFLLEHFGVVLPIYLNALFSLIVGLMIIQVACQVLVTATERFAAKMRWTHYVAGTVAEILSTLPEIVVIAFLVPVSPLTAFVVAMVTIYNNALVFSIYSYFLPHDQQGKFLMPKPITDSGSQILIAGGMLGLVVGLSMLILGVLMLSIFAIYIYKLLSDLEGEEEAEVHAVLALTENEVELRQELVFKHVEKSSLPLIFLLLILGILGAFLGGERVAEFATLTIDGLGLSGIVAAIILAGFAGMSEYVILWASHRKKEYGIALANAFGGIAQVLFLIVPFSNFAYLSRASSERPCNGYSGYCNNV